MTDIILHHYPQSPVAEKVRKALGVKGLDWRSVEVSRLPPRPDLMPLTGGYRRVPVMQIGADIYCDSQCILRELERRHPRPSFFPSGNEGLAWAFSRWTDGELMNWAVRLVLGAGAENLPPDFARDRARLYFGPDQTAADFTALVPHIVAQLRAAFQWIEMTLAGERAFLIGAAPALEDVLIHYLVWFLRGRWAGGPEFLARFPALTAWEDRMAAIGHGQARDMTASDALHIARDSTPAEAASADPDDAQGLAPGMTVAIAPDVDGGESPVEGHLHGVSAHGISLLRDDPAAGRICLHFPRAGYRIGT